MPQPWKEYYGAFPYFSDETVRPDCHPFVLDWGKKRARSIVLIHGLTDSPYYMRAIAQYFHTRLEFNVLVPLLQGHGLRHPAGMKDVSLDAWKENVEFAIAQAKERGERVSIGGFSTGGALSVYMDTNEASAIDGGVFLFCAALDLAGKAGVLLERLLRTPFADLLDRMDDRWGDDLIGFNPYRYSHMDKGGAKQLSMLINELHRRLDDVGPLGRPKQPYFIAHSEYDRVADIRGVERLYALLAPNRREFFRIGEHFNVPHSSVILREPIFAPNGSPLEPANSFFEAMMAAVERFARTHSL